VSLIYARSWPRAHNYYGYLRNILDFQLFDSTVHLSAGETDTKPPTADELAASKA
jgi:hypothetical protein